MSKHFYYFFYFLWEVYKRWKFDFALIFFLKVTYIVLTARNQEFILTLTAVPSLSQPLTYVIFIYILQQLSWYYNFYFVLFRSTISENASSSHRRCSVRRGVLKNFLKFTAKHLCQCLFFNKIAGQSFLQSTSGRLLLKCLNKKIRKQK